MSTSSPSILDRDGKLGGGVGYDEFNKSSGGKLAHFNIGSSSSNGGVSGNLVSSTQCWFHFFRGRSLSGALATDAARSPTERRRCGKSQHKIESNGRNARAYLLINQKLLIVALLADDLLIDLDFPELVSFPELLTLELGLLALQLLSLLLRHLSISSTSLSRLTNFTTAEADVRASAVDFLFVRPSASLLHLFKRQDRGIIDIGKRLQASARFFEEVHHFLEHIFIALTELLSALTFLTIFIFAFVQLGKEFDILILNLMYVAGSLKTLGYNSS
ncbi:hypothetical protein KC351_g23 [Hortaea werneckii]|nr:hypothetical protein KC351_g23 [Hortaea werneckii]